MPLFDYREGLQPFSSSATALLKLYRAPGHRCPVTVSKFPGPNQVSSYDLAELTLRKLAREEAEFNWEAFITLSGKTYAKAILELSIEELVDFSINWKASEDSKELVFYWDFFASEVLRLIKFATAKTPSEEDSTSGPDKLLSFEALKELGLLSPVKKTGSPKLLLTARGKDLVKAYLGQCHSGAVKLLQQSYWSANSKTFRSKNNLLTFIPKECWSIYLPTLDVLDKNISSFYANELRKRRKKSAV